MNRVAAKLPKLISVEGNIGSGKSTLLKLITKRFPEVKPIDQPVQDWMDTDLLGLYYKYPQRYSFTFQTYCLFSRIRALNTQKHTSNLMISERSIEADRQIFAKLLKIKGYINQTEWKLYQAYYKGFQQQLKPKSVDLFFYLKTSPQICYQRVLKRARSQQVMPLDYLKSVDQRHQDWLSNNNNTVILNGNQDFENSPEALENIVSQIKKHIFN